MPRMPDNNRCDRTGARGRAQDKVGSTGRVPQVNLALYGGRSIPIHRAHLIVAAEADRTVQLDAVVCHGRPAAHKPAGSTTPMSIASDGGTGLRRRPADSMRRDWRKPRAPVTRSTHRRGACHARAGRPGCCSDRRGRVRRNRLCRSPRKCWPRSSSSSSLAPATCIPLPAGARIHRLETLALPVSPP